RYTVVNRSVSPIVIRQFGADTTVELAPGTACPLHWSDARLEGALAVTLPASGRGGGYMWSGPIDVSNVGTFPVAVRARQDAFSSDGGVYRQASHHPKIVYDGGDLDPSLDASGSGGGGGGNGSRVGSAYGAQQTGNKVVKVEINLGGTTEAAGGGDGGLSRDVATAVHAASAAVQIIFEEEADQQTDRFPTYRLENRTLRRVFYAQLGVPGPGCMLPPESSCLFGWDQPCPPDLSHLLLRAALEPLSSMHGQRLAR
ncbi:unnamed protein product, partial [Phaeothamnion confervicola]